MNEELETLISAARKWLYELEMEVIPGAGSAEDREGYEEEAAKLRAAFEKIGEEV